MEEFLELHFIRKVDYENPDFRLKDSYFGYFDSYSSIKLNNKIPYSHDDPLIDFVKDKKNCEEFF